MTAPIELDLDRLEAAAKAINRWPLTGERSLDEFRYVEAMTPTVVIELVRRLRAADQLREQIATWWADAQGMTFSCSDGDERNFFDETPAFVAAAQGIEPKVFVHASPEEMRAAGWVRAEPRQANVITDAGLAMLQSCAPDGVKVERGDQNAD